MKQKNSIHLATVCLERNRWGNRQPSFLVSEWIPRFAADGFDGVELWENHFLAADEEEQTRLVAATDFVTFYNTYAGFEDEAAEARAVAAQAIEKLDSTGVKYNVGGDASRREEYRRNLVAWADQVPASCRLLCECHPGTVIEEIGDAISFFEGLDPVRFGVIVHASARAQTVSDWLAAFGARVQHFHLQLRDDSFAPTSDEGRESLDACLDSITGAGFEGSLSLEFTRGIGKYEDIETLYSNALVDLNHCRERLADA